MLVGSCLCVFIDLDPSYQDEYVCLKSTEVKSLGLPFPSTSECFHGEELDSLQGLQTRRRSGGWGLGWGWGARMIDLYCYVGRFAGKKDRRLGGTTRGGKVQHPRSSRAKVSLVAGAATKRSVLDSQPSLDEPLLLCVYTALSLGSPPPLITSQDLLSSSHLRLKATTSHLQIFTPLWFVHIYKVFSLITRL